MKKAVIFDFDGVIHDTLQLAYKINLKIYKNISLEEYKDFFNGNVYEHKKVTVAATEKFFAAQNREFKKLVIKEHIKEGLEKLKKDYKLFIVSSNMGKTLDNYFKNNKLTHIFTEILGRDFHESKVEKFRHLMKKYCLAKKDCLFVTDTLGDILEANKIKLKTIAVDYGFHGRERLRRGKPLKIISDFKELLPAVKDYFKK
ncbi:MAG: HAD family hydrolase [bacterium]|nr:HAD family hydrolase [bacterium]